jgi:glucose-fructose oxidoreductase
VRFAVVGLGYISQVAVLPAFTHATRDCELTALVSDDPKKLRSLARRYGVEHTYDYAQFDECLASGEIDAVFIALPNHLHCDYAVRAARAGMHVLCEKPMAITEDECREMIAAAAESDVRLMIGYRLHFEAANLRAIELLQQKKLGEPRIFSSVFTMQVKDSENIRLQRAAGGGVLWDIGIYCINAARYLFRDEPVEVLAWNATGDDPRFDEVPEMTAAILRFPGQRLATFTVSFGAADVSHYRVVGTRGDLVLEPAYDYAEKLGHCLTIDGSTREREFAERDQFAAELVYFSQCVREHRDPEPSGKEGLADVRVIRALLRSASSGASVQLDGVVTPRRRPTPRQEIRRPPVTKPRLIHARSPSGG